MKCGPAGLALITRFEGCRLESYQDCVGVWTVGYGSTENVTPGMRITFHDAIERLQDHLVILEVQIEALVKVPLSQCQFDALCCLVFNIGIGAFERSTLLKFLNEGRYDKAGDQFERFCQAGGKFVEGLLKRRTAERQLFLRG